jgi:hypothetical protein
VGETPELDRAPIHAELDRSSATFHALVTGASPDVLARGTTGTRWTNQQLLFHMLFGYIVVRALLGLVRMFGRLPDGFSRVFAAALNAATGPFHTVNYLGSCGGGRVFRGQRLTTKFDKTIASLHRHIDEESEKTMTARMHFPVGWDPFFKDTMTLYDVYRYGTQHFDHHRRQLTMPSDTTH